MRAIALVFGLLLYMFACGAANAQTCTATVTMNFGTVNLTAGSAIPTSSILTVNCIGTPGQTVRACPGIDETREMTRSGASGSMAYELYTDISHVNTWGAVGGATAPPPVDVVIDGGGSGSSTHNIYGLILPGQTTVPTDNAHPFYNATPAVTVASADATSDPTCGAIGGTNANSGTATIAAAYPPTCSVSANPLAFGNVASSLSGLSASTSIETTCSAATPYTIAMNGGLTGATDPAARQMQKSSDTLTYGIYSNSNHTQIWGDTAGVDTVGNTGTGSTQSIPVYGRIQPQPTPPTGTYSDTVVVTVNY